MSNFDKLQISRVFHAKHQICRIFKNVDFKTFFCVKGAALENSSEGGTIAQNLLRKGATFAKLVLEMCQRSRSIQNYIFLNHWLPIWKGPQFPFSVIDTLVPSISTRLDRKPTQSLFLFSEINPLKEKQLRKHFSDIRMRLKRAVMRYSDIQVRSKIAPKALHRS